MSLRAALDVDALSFGAFVKLLLRERSLSVRGFATYIGVSNSSLSVALMRDGAKRWRPPSARLMLLIDQGLSAIKPLSPSDRVLLYVKAGYLPPFECELVHAGGPMVMLMFNMDRPKIKELTRGPR